MELGFTLLELISEVIGLNPNHLKDMGCAEGQASFGHYYPPCPEPELTIGTIEPIKQNNSSFFTVVLQDQLGGLQALHRGHWVNVRPIPRALVVNHGDLLQLISNDKFISVTHKVLAKSEGPRLSIVIFSELIFRQKRARDYQGAILSEENPPVYREITVNDFVAHFYNKGINGKSALEFFKL